MPNFTIHTSPDNCMEHKNKKHIPIKKFLCAEKLFALFISCNLESTQKATNTGRNSFVSGLPGALESLHQSQLVTPLKNDTKSC